MENNLNQQTFTQPTLEQLNSEIEQLKAQISNEQQAQKAEEREFKAKTRHWSKKDFALAGMPVHLTTIDNRTLKSVKKTVGKEGTQFLAEATRPFAFKALITALVYLAIFVTICIVMNNSGYVDMLPLVYIIAGIFFIRPYKVLDGYSSLTTSVIYPLVTLICLIMSFEFLIILLIMSIAFGGNGGKAKQLQQPKIGIPKNIGLDALIEQGEAYDCYFKMMNIVDRSVAKAETTYYENQLKDIEHDVKLINEEMPYASSEGQVALHQVNDALEKEADNAKWHLGDK